jgi:hypothetical protein
MFDTRAVESGVAHRIGAAFDPDEPGAEGGIEEDLPEGRVWGAGGRTGPRLLAPGAPGAVPARRRPAPGSLRAIAAQADAPAPARERALPVPEELSGLLPEGLRRGSTVGVTGPGATSLALATVAAASAAGSWVVAVGVEDLGLAAAAELGVALERLAVVAPPPSTEWGTVVAALVGSVDLVLVAPRERVRGADLRRLEARSRERGSVLVHLGDPARWPAAHDLVLTVRSPRWLGVGEGHGRLAARQVVVEAIGRREAARARRAELLLPGEGGRLAPAGGTVGVVAGEGASRWAGADLEAGEADTVLRPAFREVG